MSDDKGDHIRSKGAKSQKEKQDNCDIGSTKEYQEREVEICSTEK